MSNIWRPLKSIVKAAVALMVLSVATHLIAHAQATLNSTAYIAPLPDAPQPAQSGQSATSSPSPPTDPQPTAVAGISGTILDTNRNVLRGATVSLMLSSGPLLRTIKSGPDGQFAFSGLSPDDYQLTIAAPGMLTFESPRIPLRAGEMHLVPPITLAVATSAINVTVVGNKKALSIEQVKIAEQQHVIGVIPNFYTTYNWNAPPLEAKQKFQLSIHSVLDPFSFLAVAGVAGAEQYLNTFPEFGSGFQGYAKRYGAAYATHFTANVLSDAVYPSVFHQDPRYFYKGTGSFGSRALYAVSSAFITRGDDGRREPNYSAILGNFTAAAISNLYYPPAERGASLVLFNGLADTGADIGLNLIREFVLKQLTFHHSKNRASPTLASGTHVCKACAQGLLTPPAPPR